MKCGDIVLVTYPATNLKSRKVRPALIISSQKYNNRESDRILIPISSNVVRTCPDDIIIENDNQFFGKTGLRVTSAIRAGKIFTAHICIIKRRLGYLSDVHLKIVQRKIGEILNLKSK